MRNKKGIKYAVVIFALVAALNGWAQTSSQVSLVDFLMELFKENRGNISAKYQSEYASVCQKLNLNPEADKNQETYFKLKFFHELFTGESAENCSDGGVLKVKYFWHWVTPNPRHEIFEVKSGKLLKTIPPPPKLKKYASLADIDRTPAYFLSDIFTETPKYEHNECGKFYSFGWCSEREMAFTLLMSLYGHAGKIVKKGIHVQSEYWLEFKDKEGNSVPIIAVIDNTFHLISLKRPSEGSKDKWLKAHSGDKLEKWYNKTAASESEKREVKKIKIGEPIQKRIKESVSVYFSTVGHIHKKP